MTHSFLAKSDVNWHEAIYGLCLSNLVYIFIWFCGETLIYVIVCFWDISNYIVYALHALSKSKQILSSKHI